MSIILIFSLTEVIFLMSFQLGSFWSKGMKNHLLKRGGWKILRDQRHLRRPGHQLALAFSSSVRPSFSLLVCLPCTHPFSSRPIWFLSLPSSAHGLFCSLLSCCFLPLHSGAFPLPAQHQFIHHFCSMLSVYCGPSQSPLQFLLLTSLFSCSDFRQWVSTC